MSKVSSNAGKHPYLRTDEDEYRNLFNDPKFECSGGKRISEIKEPFFKVEIDTEYVDKNKKNIHFNDTVKFQNREYRIDYWNEKWVMVNMEDHEDIDFLSETAHLTVLSKLYN
jgi:hypothetical protein